MFWLRNMKNIFLLHTLTKVLVHERLKCVNFAGTTICAFHLFKTMPFYNTVLKCVNFAGTTICASHLFKNMPVRRQFYNSAKKKKEELKKVEDLLMWYGAIRPGTRLSLRHGKDLIWQKNIVVDVRSALLGVLGRSVVSQLEVKKMKTDNPEVM